MSGSLESKTFTLNTGARIPAVGFGTWKAGPGEAAAAVKAAFEAGYRHFVRELECLFSPFLLANLVFRIVPPSVW